MTKYVQIFETLIMTIFMFYGLVSHWKDQSLTLGFGNSIAATTILQRFKSSRRLAGGVEIGLGLDRLKLLQINLHLAVHLLKCFRKDFKLLLIFLILTFHIKQICQFLAG